MYSAVETGNIPQAVLYILAKGQVIRGCCQRFGGVEFYQE